jgi:predicted HD phosphohydrolase
LHPARPKKKIPMKCPGQDRRYFKPQDVSEIPCSRCGRPVEFFKDDPFRRCPSCGARVINPKVSLGCAQWCSHAVQCLGYDPKKAAGAPAPDSAEVSLADRVIESMKREFNGDEKRIAHALLVLEHSERILRDAPGDPRIVIAAALLHDIGIHEAERKHGSAAGRYQEIEGPPIARRILESLAFDEPAIAAVCEIIAHHHSRGVDTPEFRVLWDADNLVNLQFAGSPPDRVKAVIEKTFLTEPGRRRAEEIFLPESAKPQ